MSALAHAWLDRELILAGFFHDLRGGLTSLQGCLDLDGPSMSAILRSVSDRLIGICDQVGTVGSLREAAVDLGPALHLDRPLLLLLKGPAELLSYAIDEVVFERLQVQEGEAVTTLTLHGVSSADGEHAWTRQEAEQWLQAGGTGYAGARLRIAARLLGAIGQAYETGGADGKGSLLIQFRRG